MFLLKKVLSAWLLPPFGLLVFALAALAIGRGKKLSVLIAGSGISIAILMSMPFVARQLVRPLEPPPISLQTLHEAQAIVVLGCGIYAAAPEYGGDTVSRFTLERIRYAAKLARESGLPLLVAGGSVYDGLPEAQLMRRALESEFAVPVRWVEDRSIDTAENAANSFRLLNQSGVKHIVLVTHAWHMPRATYHFRQYGLQVIEAPTGFTTPSHSLLQQLQPSEGAFQLSAIAIHEWMGLLLSRYIPS